MIAETKTCLCCHKPIHGRSDKKFCGDACRNTHHNGLHGSTDISVRVVNHLLRKNHHILKKIMGVSGNRGRCARKKLLLAGFNFHYFTHRYVNHHAHEYCCCYEFEYRVSEEMVYISRKNRIEWCERINT